VGQTVVIEDDRKSDVADDFVTVYEAHYPRLVRALQIGGLDRPSAEDVAQEAFARTLGHWRRVRLGTNPPTGSRRRRQK
jgi:DNA-directed RNA polymerase specialized sigma24 family protein